MNNKPVAGYSLIEVMIATLLFSIILLGFIQYQQVIFKHYHYLSNKLKADNIAFEWLDSYPQNANHILPAGWQYTLQTKPLPTQSQCKMVLVIITIPKQSKTQQQRLFCN